MSFFDASKSMLNILVDTTFRMSKNPMKKDKMCYEFVWKGGSGYPRIGVAVSSQMHVRFYENSGMGWIGPTRKLNEGSSIKTTLNEPIMICFDKSNTSNYNFSAIKGNLVRTLTFYCSSLSPKSEWRIASHNQENSGSDNVELHLDRRKITHKIPPGYSPLITQTNSFRSKRSFISRVLFVYVFVTLS